MLIFKWFSFTFVNLFEISNLWDPTFPHPIILGRSEKWSHRKNIFQAHTLYDTADIHSPIPSFRAQREIFLALCSFLLLSQKGSPFPLSHIGRYTSVQKRSLDFARDDDTGIALSKHIRCTLREINPFSPTVISSTARNLPCTPLLLAPFAEAFSFSAFTHTTLSPPARKIPPLRSGWRYRNSAFQTYPLYATWNKPILLYRHFEHSEKSSLHSALSCFLRRWIPVFCYHTYDIIPSCKKDPSTSLGMTLQE